MWFIIQLLCNAILVTYSGCNDMAWQINSMRKAFHWSALQIVFFSVHVMLYFLHSDFFNIIHLWAIVQHVKCTFLYCFYTHLQLEMALSVFIFLSSHLFCLHMFVIDSGWCHMAWQMMSLPVLGCISWCGPKIIFGHMYISVSPQKHFLKIINLVGIASHITCTFLSDYSINFHVYMLICVFIFDIFTYCFLGILGIDCWCRDMAWQIDPLIFHWMLHWQFCWVDITLMIWHCMTLTSMSHVWVCLHFWAYDTTFGCTISCTLYIYHCLIYMSYLSLTLLYKIAYNYDYCYSSLWHMFVLHIFVNVHTNFHFLYMLCLHCGYGS